MYSKRLHRFIPLALILCLAPLLSAQGRPQPQARISLNVEQRADLDRISAYLNTIKSAEGGFTQISHMGDIVQGKISIQKPGKVRFDYEQPSPTLVVCDGSTIYVQNRTLKTVDRYPLAGTPLELILRENVNLKGNQAILNVRRDGDSLMVEARSSTKRRKANITLVFADAPMELRQWTVIDDQGLSTTVAFRDLRPVATLPDSLFKLAGK